MLPHIRHLFKNFFPLLSGITAAALIAVVFYGLQLQKRIVQISKNYDEIEKNQSSIKEFLPENLYEDHLKLMEKDKLESDVADLQTQLTEVQKSAPLDQTSVIYKLLSDFQTKVNRNTDVKLKTDNTEELMKIWGVYLLNKQFDKAVEEIQSQNTILDQDYQKYVASLPPPPVVTGGYTFTTVTTEKGTKHGVYLLKIPLNDVLVKTVSASSGDCKNNCPTKSLDQYVKENGGFAGMNGTYFCPPDYKDCSGKTNTFDYALYDSQDKKWINKKALSWFKTGLITFNGSTANFYKKSSDYGGGGVSAGISNYPSLVKDGDIVVSDSDLTSYQKLKGMKGAIGIGGENLYLAQITNASVIEAAYVMKALGVKHALNLDGGGSTAMYMNGGYVLGPGRSLPNAIVLVRK